jgi:hypothetical protein
VFEIFGAMRTALAIGLCLLFFVGLAEATSLQAGSIYAEGVAEIIGEDRKAARQKAITDALNQAALSFEAHVMATEVTDGTEISLQSQKIRATRSITKYSIAKEWEIEAEYHVVVRVEDSQYESADKNTIHAVKRKIAFMQFDAINTVQLDDIRNVYSEFPKEISKRLDASGGWLVNHINGLLPRNSDAQQPELIKQIARETGAQFLISGLILDAGISKKSGIFGSSFLGSNSRHFKIEMIVHDGLTGSRLASHNLEVDATGDVAVGDDKVFGGGAFFGTASGRAINKLIDEAAKNIRTTLACLPLSTQVVRVAGKSVYLDAGSVSMLKVGDKLTIYTTDKNTSVNTLRGVSLGMPERPSTTVTLIKIQPMFSIGELSEDSTIVGVRPGNLARFEFSEKSIESPSCLQ